jgi:hypothetical protein
MGTLFRLRVGASNILPQSINAIHMGPLSDNDNWQTLTCPIAPCSDLTVIYDNSSQKWLRVTIDRLRNG